jgi:hypothetical protein
MAIKINKFNAEKYINHNYVENEDAIISIYIKNVDAFYNEFDADELTISDNILKFINNRVENIPYKYNITLEFETPLVSYKQNKKSNNYL